MPARRILKASESANDGERRLREQLRYASAAALAKRVGCDSTAVRRWAKGDRTPTPEWRKVLRETLGIPEEAWELAIDEHNAATLPRG